ncbi:putative signal transduction histidine-protein kinase [Podospora aff. communis PSN243]|uniref:histidine kinase n=1 Tax=Podospora aff. communis PSN243 TaxID=3040156 RepID=A0AAV9GBY5_9PEZI|nr:putative signal transduction histidine-protein kinase [Podospora aff. communis PSN243]
MKMRVAIREQLAALVILAVLVSLAIVSLPTWFYVNNFVRGVESGGLALTASLKAARISSEIELVQTTCLTISTRLLLQNGFQAFYDLGTNDTVEEAWTEARKDMATALSSTGFSGLLQARLYSRNTTGNKYGLLNITGDSVSDNAPILLPYTNPNGSRAVLGDGEFGFPPSLYPNVSYADLGRANQFQNNTRAYAAFAFPGIALGNGSDGAGVLLGPLVINSTFALISITVPVRKIGNPGYIVGYMTVVASAGSIVDVQLSDEGLGNTGTMLLIGSTNPWNHFDDKVSASNRSFQPPKDSFNTQPVQFLLPPVMPSGHFDRHDKHSFASGNFDAAFPLESYPVARDVLYNKNATPNNATSELSTLNEQGWAVAVGAARPQTSLVSWAVIVEQDRREAFEPIRTLRDILLGCVFGTAGLVLLIVFPCAHLSVMPIRRLKAATEKSIAPPGYEDFDDDSFDEENPSSGGTTSGRSEKGWFSTIRRRIRKRRRARLRAGTTNEPRRRQFKIPARVDDRKHFVTDELTELTQTFNEMTEELVKQYTSLDEKVAERTRELEISKKAAEAANESKTLFIANISHELKTPLNGIMGMCAVCMEEDDIGRIKQSLKTLYKSGDLLLHLLEDLLSFSKNQIGQQVSLEEKEFRLGDIRSQMLAIFDKQVRESRITFTVNFVGADILDGSPSPERRISLDRRLPALGPAGVGRLKDMCLWGDQHRILQVIINLVNNSLKFTPPGGKVELRIRCVGEAETTSDESRTSSLSKTGSHRAGRTRNRVGSASTNSASSKGAHSPASQQLKNGTALAINPLDPKPAPRVFIRERSPTPPPSNAKSYIFEFEVEDTGPGIAEHMQQKIFEPFVQGDLGLSKKFGGTGLGLSICSQLATIMGGSISLKSTVGVGTTFTMLIPLKYVKDRASSTASSSLKSRPPSVGSIDGETARNSVTKSVTENQHQPVAPTVLDKQPRLVGLSQPFFATNPNPPRPSKEDQMAAIDRAMSNREGQGKLRVLVADDNSTNIEVVSRMLKLEEIYDVTIAKDGQEAYDLVKANMENNQRFDVIFMDIQMPNLDGLQSTRLIRKMGYSAPIVALTAFSEESNVKECMESGMDEFLSKPIRRPALKQVLKKFATIEEEPETSSLEKKTPAQTPQREGGDPLAAEGASSMANGGAPPQSGAPLPQPNGVPPQPNGHGTKAP